MNATNTSPNGNLIIINFIIDIAKTKVSSAYLAVNLSSINFDLLCGMAWTPAVDDASSVDCIKFVSGV